MTTHFSSLDVLFQMSKLNNFVQFEKLTDHPNIIVEICHYLLHLELCFGVLNFEHKSNVSCGHKINSLTKKVA